MKLENGENLDSDSLDDHIVVAEYLSEDEAVKDDSSEEEEEEETHVTKVHNNYFSKLFVTDVYYMYFPDTRFSFY